MTLTGNKFESLVIEFDKNMFSRKKNIIVSIFYIAPTSSLKLLNQKLETTLDIIQREKKYFYIMGNFNVNCIDEFLDSNVYSQHFILYAHVNNCVSLTVLVSCIIICWP